VSRLPDDDELELLAVANIAADPVQPSVSLLSLPGGADEFEDVDDHPPWLQQWIVAAQANAIDDELRALVWVPTQGPPTPKLRALTAAAYVRLELLQRFDGPDAAPAVGSFQESRQRGFAACAEASAAVAAVAHLAGARSLGLCYERPTAAQLAKDPTLWR
jgi:hypothetical protein